jgi:hypothetical protein
MDLTTREELAEMVRNESTALVRAYDEWFEAIMKTHERPHFRGESFE